MDIINNMSFWISIIVLIILVVIFAALRIKVKNKQASQSDNDEVYFMVQYLGGIDNIISARATMSKITVQLIDPERINVEAIKGLGASGIVQTKKNTTIILGDASQDFANKINEMKQL